MSNDLVTDIRDFTHLVWSERANTSGTGGTFLKARDKTSRSTRYYKLSCYDAYRGIYGHECVNELIASRLLNLLGIEHVPYRLINARIVVDDTAQTTWLSESENFIKPNDKKQAFDLFYSLRKNEGESPLEFCKRHGWLDQIEKMMLFDYLIVNRDRHGANIEVVKHASGKLSLAPLFDNGLSFVFSCYDDEARAEAFDPLCDVNANNFIGTRSLQENLKLIRASVRVAAPTLADLTDLTADLEGILPDAHRTKISEILCARWKEASKLGLVDPLQNNGGDSH